MQSAGCDLDRPAILLFAGHGTSPNDVTAVERILSEHHLSYAAADAARLNAMSERDLEAYRLPVVPGGNFEEMGNSLDHATPVRVRHAVGNGLNYLGICAGAFIAGILPYTAQSHVWREVSLLRRGSARHPQGTVPLPRLVTAVRALLGGRPAALGMG